MSAKRGERGQMEIFQRIMRTFKNLDTKLDKIQEDVNKHGNALCDLRIMIANMSLNKIRDTSACSDERSETTPQLLSNKKTTALQHEGGPHKEGIVTKRSNAIHPLPRTNRLRSKSFIGLNNVGRKTSVTTDYRGPKSHIMTGKQSVQTHLRGHGKTGPPGKINALREAKGVRGKSLPKKSDTMPI